MLGNEQGKSETGVVRPQAIIGASISVQGEISGEEDILVEGSVEGTINLKKNIVTVAQTGKVRAHIYGVVIHVEGEVTGDLFGTDRVIIHGTGRVYGNVTAPRICVEDGAKLKGNMNTDAPSELTSTRTIEISRPASKNTEVTRDMSLTRLNSNGTTEYTGRTNN